MKNVIVKIEAKTSQVFLTKKTLGISGENLQGNIVISFVDKFVNGVAELKMQMPDGTLGSIHLDKVNESYVLPIRSSLLTQVGYIYMQLKITESGSEIPIFKSNDFYLEVKKAIETETTIPEEYPTWEEILNEKIAEVNNAIQEVNNLDIDIEENILTITKKDGSKKSQNVKGEPGTPGKDGVTPTLKVGTTTTGEAGTNANVTMNQNGTEYTLNFTIPKGKDGIVGSGGDVDLSDYAKKTEIPTKTSQLTNDSGFITEHQDLTDYVKNTDYATSSKVGLVRPGNGLFMSGTTGAILVAKASTEQIDKKTDNYYPIVSSNLEYAVKSVGDNYYATIQDMNDLIGDIESLLSEV